MNISNLNITLKQQSSESTETKPQLNPAATSFYPGTSHPFTPGSPYAPGASRVIVATSGEKSDMSEFARFMVSRELINTSLMKFDDRAESYRAWKATFKAAIANLNLTAEQELDLMIKWLGPGSTNRIKSLKTVYVGQAEAGLAAAWQRLERTFGSAEAIEKALFKRLQDIPKINLKEVHKLQDLSDLLMELELAKRDPRLSGLCYLDTAHGVNPIVVKLPYSLQEKWATSVSRYKRVHDVTFPPFIQFSNGAVKSSPPPLPASTPLPLTPSSSYAELPIPTKAAEPSAPVYEEPTEELQVLSPNQVTTAVTPTSARPDPATSLGPSLEAEHPDSATPTAEQSICLPKEAEVEPEELPVPPLRGIPTRDEWCSNRTVHQSQV
ncbi:uncharacterized protein ACNLHF_015279 [Anomaloglossus baeobatrachus]